uniref:NADH dehydrogenase subunit 2 n=1 Tax=Halidaya aurea TaxID=1918247 RepID=UPI00200142EE|nr:NADH dehydrogenase subunit 2 [Halidaya aurea]UOW81223.1 NADH dehydrogenase subunit 2 [Halidaya aurea]
MFNNSTKFIFFSILVMGTMITVSANSWLSAWMGLEINLLAFIPLMSDNKLMSTESSLKYFLTQALASAIMLFSVILFLLNSEMMIKNSITELMIFSALLLKSGSAPFHFWFPEVMEGLTWMNAMILLTWQKIAPLMLMTYTMSNPLMLLSIILSSLIGAIGGLNQTSLRKLMAYSSINHLSWMLMAMWNSNYLWMTYFMFYIVLNFSMIFMFNMFKTTHINQLFSLFFTSKTMKFIFFFNLLSMSGLPPFLGFFPKLIVIQSLTLNNQLFMLTFMIFMALITIYFYLRLCYSAFMLNYFENNWTNKSKFNTIYMNTFLLNSFISIFGLFLIYPLYLYF